MNYELCCELGYSFKNFCRSLRVSDKIKLSESEVDALVNCWLSEYSADGLAFLRNNTVPLPLVEFEFQTPKEINSDGESYKCSAIFCNVDSSKTSFTVHISILDSFAMEFGVEADKQNKRKALFYPVCAYYSDEIGKQLQTATQYDWEQIEGFFASVLESVALSLWCAIQMFLLNPVTKEFIGAPKVEKETDSKRLKNGKQGKRVVRYVRHYYINEDALAAIKGEAEKRRCTCPAWYVIGHWRHYKNGKSVFVQPYWKGEMRKTKTAVEARQREIVIKEA